MDLLALHGLRRECSGDCFSCLCIRLRWVNYIGWARMPPFRVHSDFLKQLSETPKWREARAEARAVALVVGREALRECVFASREGRRASRVLCASGERAVCVMRETEGEERATARAMSIVVGREALRV